MTNIDIFSYRTLVPRNTINEGYSGTDCISTESRAVHCPHRTVTDGNAIKELGTCTCSCTTNYKRHQSFFSWNFLCLQRHVLLIVLSSCLSCPPRYEVSYSCSSPAKFFMHVCRLLSSCFSYFEQDLDRGIRALFSGRAIYSSKKDLRILCQSASLDSKNLLRKKINYVNHLTWQK